MDTTSAQLFTLPTRTEPTPLHGGSTAWRPDEQLVDAAIQRRLTATNTTHISRTDRAWLIAQLTHKGYPARDIADMLHMSIRLVKDIRGEAVAILTAQLLRATTDKHARDRRKPDQLAVLIADQVREIDTLKAKNDRLFHALDTTRRKCTNPPAVRCPSVEIIYLPHRYRRKPKPPAQPTLFETT